MKRYITHNVETKLARALISGSVSDHSTVEVDARDGELTFGVAGTK
ncbi:MAG: hypothetical protein IJ702_03115 [Fretibacterium sp.]|nr:hypothetical protein [Fretibacterium sp.]